MVATAFAILPGDNQEGDPSQEDLSPGLKELRERFPGKEYIIDQEHPAAKNKGEIYGSIDPQKTLNEKSIPLGIIVNMDKQLKLLSDYCGRFLTHENPLKVLTEFSDGLKREFKNLKTELYAVYDEVTSIQKNYKSFTGQHLELIDSPAIVAMGQIYDRASDILSRINELQSDLETGGDPKIHSRFVGDTRTEIDILRRELRRSMRYASEA